MKKVSEMMLSLPIFQKVCVKLTVSILGYVGHADQLAPTLKELTRLEKQSQNLFLHRFYNTQMPA